jgi:hypothetical protein
MKKSRSAKQDVVPSLLVERPKKEDWSQAAPGRAKNACVIGIILDVGAKRPSPDGAVGTALHVKVLVAIL